MFNYTLVTTEDSINLEDLDFDWQLSEATKELENFVKAFSPESIGLTDKVLHSVCPEANHELIECFDSYAEDQLLLFYNECLSFIDEIFPRGKGNLIEVLGKRSIV